MDEQTKARMEEAGYCVGTVQQFLGLTSEENELVETRVAISTLVYQLRQKTHLTQQMVAEKAGTSQSRVAKVEKNDPSVSIELLLRVAYALGATRKEVAKALS